MHKLIEFIKMECPQVDRLPKPLSEQEADKLLKDYTYEQITTQLMKMENYKPLLEKYRSAYLTLLKWFDMDKKQGYPASIRNTQRDSKIPAGVPSPVRQSMEEIIDKSEKFKFLTSNPPGESFTDPKGREWLVVDETFLQHKQSGSLMPILQYIKEFNHV